MKKILLLPSLFILLLCHSTFAQKNLQLGYIILNTNDTLKGYIDYKEWHRNPSAILFSSSKEDITKSYTANDIIYFEVDGRESYERYLVSISLDTQLFSDLGDKDKSTKTDAVFLKVLHMGKNVSLFSYKDDVKLRFYVKQINNSTPEELLNSVYKVNGKVMNEQQYRYQLLKIATTYLPGGEKILTSINHAGYVKKTLLQICYSINGLNENEIYKENKNWESPFRFFAGAGVGQGSISFEGDNHFTGANSSSSLMPVLGGGVDIFPIPAVGRLYLRNSLTVSEFKSEATSATEHYYKATEHYYFQFKQVNISVHSQLNYNLYNKPDFKWFFGAGGGFNISNYPQNQQTFIREGLGNTTRADSDYLEFIKEFWLNFSVRSGVAVRNLEVSLSYLPKSSLSEYVSFSVYNSSLQLQVNYLFKRKKPVPA